MTLSTHIYVLDPVDGRDLFNWVNKNLLNCENPRFTEKTNDLSNSPGQGLDAWFMLKWWDEPQRFDDGIDDTWDEWDVEWSQKKQQKIGAPYYADLDFDTAYGFNKYGMGCTELHATYIVRLYREYFESRGIDIAWQDEYSGDIWRNLDSEGMTKFLGAGDQAMDWFKNILQPAIQRVAEEKGGTVSW